MSGGELIYNGACDASIQQYFASNFKIPVPKYFNPADFLIMLATDPSFISKKLTQ